MSILTKHQAADVPHVPDDRLGLNQLLDDRPNDDQQVVRADHHIPDNKSINHFMIGMISLKIAPMTRK